MASTPLDSLIKAIAEPTDENIAAAMAHDELRSRLQGLDPEDFRALAAIITRFLALSKALHDAHQRPTVRSRPRESAAPRIRMAGAPGKTCDA